MSEQPTFFTGRIAQVSRRHRLPFIIASVVVLVVGIGLLGVGADTEIEGGGKGESGRAFVLLEDRFQTAEGAPSEVIVFSHPTLTVDDPEYRATVEGLMDRLRELRVEQAETRGGTSVTSSTRIVSSTLTHYDIGAPREQSPLVAAGAAGGDVSFASATLEGELVRSAAASVPAAIDKIDLVVDEVEAYQAASDGFTISIGGDASAGSQSDTLLQEDFGIASTFSLPITLIIMLIATGVLLSAIFPIVLAFAGIFVSLGILAVISQFFPLEAIYIQVVLFMGLAAGIDYALFLIMRYRSERLEGTEALAFRESLSPQDAIVRGWSNTGKNVSIAATTTVLALLGMFFVGDPVFASLAIAAIVVIVVSWAMAIVFLPAFTGEGMRRFRVPWLSRTHLAGADSFLNPLASRVVAFSWRHPLPVTVISAGFLAVIAIPLFTLNLAFNGAAALHDDVRAKVAFIALEENFTLGLTAPARVVVDAGKNQNVFDPAIQGGVEALRASIIATNESAAQAGEHVPFGQPISVELNDAGDTEVINVPLNADVGQQEAFDAIDLLRGELVPAAFDDTPAVQALVTGASAGNVDFRDNIQARTPIVLGFVVISAFVTLLVMYRSPMIAFMAVTLNGLAVASSYGILVVVFQEGYALESILNFKATGIIESWLPLFVFSILFGISMDYITFAIGRIKELHDDGMATDEAVLEGTRGGFGTVFSAALIMIAVAAIFAFMRNIGIQQFGFAVAVAVLIDATLILAVLLPAAARLAGERLWWLPSWLEWLPGKPAKGT